MIKLIIFDWDDVITIGSRRGYFTCYHETLCELGVNLSPEEEQQRILAKWSHPHREELRELLKEHPELLNKACNIYEGKLFGSTFIRHLSLIPGTKELLEKLADRYILAVATGVNPKLLKEVIMPKFQIPAVFSQILSTYEISDATKHKPDPYMLKKIMADQGVTPDQTIMVGDAKTDVLMAQSALVQPVVVLTGHLTQQEAESLHVQSIIKDVTQLEDILNNS